MAYFKIGSTDFSACVSELKIGTSANYTMQLNAAGNGVVDYINKKRIIEVTIIPLDSAAMVSLQDAIKNLNVNISFRNPITASIENNVACIIPEQEVEYYTIQNNRVSFKSFSLKFIEL